MAANDERNFRSAYYEKVGFRSVEEKKSLEILLKDEPLDKGKLKQYCLRFCVPATYRNLIWKVLLGVVETYKGCHSFIMDQRKQEYNDLLHVLTVIKAIDQNTPKPQVFYAMYLIQSGNFTFDTNLTNHKGFIPIVQSLMQFFEDDTDVYWLAKNFYINILKIENEFPKLISCTYSLLEKEDYSLYEHLKRIGIIDNLPLNRWFYCCFAGILNENALGKIWDKVCGGSYKILSYVAVVIFLNLKLRIMKCKDLPSILHCIRNIPEETADVIANKTIDLWQHHGSPLTIHDKPKP